MLKALAAAAPLALAVLLAAPAHAETALSAFCADNATQLQRTMHESGLDPATWANDPKNLAKFGLDWPGGINTLYHSVIDKGAPYITSYWSNENANVQWKCAGQ